MIDIEKAIHLISTKKYNNQNNFKHYFYLDGRLLYITHDPIFNTKNVNVLLDIYLYDYVVNKKYVYVMEHYQITDNNLKFMRDTYNTYMKFIANRNEFYNDKVWSHNKVIDECFKANYCKIKRLIKINKILNAT